MKHLTIIPALLLLSACDASGDGYQFGQKEYDRETVVVHKVEYRRLEDMRLSLIHI